MEPQTLEQATQVVRNWVIHTLNSSDASLLETFRWACYAERNVRDKGEKMSFTIPVGKWEVEVGCYASEGGDVAWFVYPQNPTDFQGRGPGSTAEFFHYLFRLRNGYTSPE